MRILATVVLAGLLLVALPVAALFAVAGLDPVYLGDRVSAWASERLGRRLALDGGLEIGLGRTLRLSARGVRLANAPWGSRPEMLGASRVLLEIDTRSLLDRTLLVQRLEVDDLDLSLERTADGANNWDLGTDLAGDFAWPRQLPVVVREVDLPRAQLRFTGPRLTRPLELRFDRLTQESGADGMLELAGLGTANESAFALQGTAGPFDGLVAGRDFTASLAGTVGEFSIESRAAIDDLARPVDSRLSLRFAGPSATELAARFGVRNLGDGPVDLDARLMPLPDGAGLAGKLDGAVGDYRLTGSGRLIDPAGAAGLALDLDVAGPDLSLLGGLIGVDRLPEQPFELDVRLERSGERLTITNGRVVLPDSRLELSGTVQSVPALAGNDLEFRLEGADVARFRELVRLPGLAGGPFELSGRLRQGEGGVERLDVTARTALGRFSVEGELGAPPGYHDTRLEFEAQGPSLDLVGRAAGLKGLPAAAFDASGEVVLQPAALRFRRAALRSGGTELTLTGSVGKKPLGRDTDLRFALSGRELRDLCGLLGVGGLPAGRYEAQGRLRRLATASRLDEVRGKVGGAGFTLRGRVADRIGSDTDVVVSIDGPRLEAFRGLAGGYELPAGPFRLAGGLVLTGKKLELRNLRLAAAGAEGTVSANLALPLDRVRGRFDVTARGPDLSRLLPALGEGARRGGDFELELRGSARDGTWDLDAARLATAAGSVSGSGVLAGGADLTARKIRVEARAPDLAEAGRILGVELPAQPFELTAQFSGKPVDFEITGASGRLGASDFSGRLALDRRGRRTALDLDLESGSLDLRPFLAAAPKPAAPGPPAKSRLIPDTPLPFDLLGRFDGRVSVRAGRLVLQDSAVRDARLLARLSDGRAGVESLALRFGRDGRLDLGGDLWLRPPGARIEVGGRITGVSFEPQAGPAGPAGDGARFDVELQATAEGATLRQLAGTVAGQARVTGGAGTLDLGAGSKLFNTVRREIVAVVRPGARERKLVRVRCVALAATASGGVLRTAPVLAIETEDTNIVGQGLLDLRTEALELYLRTTPRERYDLSLGEIVNPYVKLGGTLAQPALAVDSRGALFNGATAVLTGGLSVVARGAWERMFRVANPCAEAFAAADRVAGDAGGSPTALEKIFRGPLRRRR